MGCVHYNLVYIGKEFHYSSNTWFVKHIVQKGCQIRQKLKKIFVILKLFFFSCHNASSVYICVHANKPTFTKNANQMLILDSLLRRLK